jgi:hypothetical protein
MKKMENIDVTKFAKNVHQWKLISNFEITFLLI